MPDGVFCDQTIHPETFVLDWTAVAPQEEPSIDCLRELAQSADRILKEANLFPSPEREDVKANLIQKCILGDFPLVWLRPHLLEALRLHLIQEHSGLAFLALVSILERLLGFLYERAGDFGFQTTASDDTKSGGPGKSSGVRNPDRHNVRQKFLTELLSTPGQDLARFRLS